MHRFRFALSLHLSLLLIVRTCSLSATYSTIGAPLAKIKTSSNWINNSSSQGIGTVSLRSCNWNTGGSCKIIMLTTQDDESIAAQIGIWTCDLQNHGPYSTNFILVTTNLLASFLVYICAIIPTFWKIWEIWTHFKPFSMELIIWILYRLPQSCVSS